MFQYKNACPPEDVGSAPGYFDFLEAALDSNHEEHESMLAWCGGEFDPVVFDKDATNRQLKRIKL